MSRSDRDKIQGRNITLEVLEGPKEPSVSQGAKAKSAGTVSSASVSNVLLQEGTKDARAKILMAFSVALVLCIVLFTVLPAQMFDPNHKLTFAWWVQCLISNVQALFGQATGQVTNNGIGTIACRMVAVAFAGAALGVSGAVFQGSMGNPLASPTTLGVTSGGMLGVVIWTLFGSVAGTSEGFSYWSDYSQQLHSQGLVSYVLETYQMSLFALLGCGLVVGLVMLIAKIAGKGRVSKVALIIAGQVFAAVVGAAVSVIRYWLQYNGNYDQVNVIKTISLGNLVYIGSAVDVALIAIPVGICLVLAIAMRHRLNALTLDPLEAQSLGVDVGRTQAVSVALCTVMTAVVVSFCGFIGFVGFLVPHIVRGVFGADFNYLVPASAVVGGLYLVIVYGACSALGIFMNSLGVFTTVVGAAAFLVLVFVRRGRSEASWL